MDIAIMAVGRTQTAYLREGIEEYMNRLRRYAPCTLTELPDVRRGRTMPQGEQKRREGEMILERLQPSDIVVLLDERGHQRTSQQTAEWLQRHMASGRKRLVLVIGGPYGFSEEVYARADERLSLSAMTFNHEMVRLFLAEQVYRALTILRGEPYHH